MKKKRNTEILSREKYQIISVVFIVLGLFILLSLLLVDNPIGPPILGNSNMNVDTSNGIFLAFMFGSVSMLILSSLLLLFNKSKVWLIIGLINLVVGVGVFQGWVNTIITVYMKMEGGIPIPSI